MTDDTSPKNSPKSGDPAKEADAEVSKLEQIFGPHLNIANQKQIISGWTVALAMIPEAVAFSFVAKVSPPVALTAAWIMCFVTAAIGGRPGMISGATGSMAVIMTNLVSDHGVEYLFYAVIMCGVIQIILGFCNIHKALRYVTFPVKLGFLNGLSLVIAKSQIESFMLTHDEIKKSPNPQKTEHFKVIEFSVATNNYIDNTEKLVIMFILTSIALGLNFLPERFQGYPLALISIVFVTILEWVIVRPILLDEGTTLVEDMASLEADFLVPIFSDKKYQDNLPSLFGSDNAFTKCLLTSLYLCVIGLTESLMTLQKVDTMIPDSPPGDGRREVLAQGLANCICGFFGSMGGCAMIGQSMINVRNGGIGRLSGITAGITTLLIMVVIHDLIGKIPVASLVGVMWCVSYHTFERATIGLMYEAFTGNKWDKSKEQGTTTKEQKKREHNYKEDMSPTVRYEDNLLDTTKIDNPNPQISITVITNGSSGGKAVVNGITTGTTADNSEVGLVNKSRSKDGELAGGEARKREDSKQQALEFMKEDEKDRLKEMQEDNKEDNKEGSKPHSRACSKVVVSSPSSSKKIGRTPNSRRESFTPNRRESFTPTRKHSFTQGVTIDLSQTPSECQKRSILSFEEESEIDAGYVHLTKFDSIIVIIVTLGTLFTNLAIAVAIGVFLSTMWEKFFLEKPINVDINVDVSEGNNIKEQGDSVAVDMNEVRKKLQESSVVDPINVIVESPVNEKKDEHKSSN